VRKAAREADVDPELVALLGGQVNVAGVAESTEDGAPGGLRLHPACDLFPPASNDELDAMAQSIERDGLLEPVVLIIREDERMAILDGRNRMLACSRAEVEPTFVIFDPEIQGDPVQYVLNKHNRRNLTPGQRAIVADKLATGPHGGDRKSAGYQGASMPLDQAAKSLSVSPKLVKNLRLVRKRAPDLIPEIESGEMSIGNALKKLDQQTERADKVQARQVKASKVDAAERAIKICRDRGLLPVDFVLDDDTRTPSGADPAEYDGPVDDYMAGIWDEVEAQTTHYDLVPWVEFQPYYVEVAVEKAGLKSEFSSAVIRWLLSQR
jgi:ParB-like chromosome segregation protein Spo0J